MYSFSLASKKCCTNQTTGKPGPTGPAGIGPIGPIGYTGLPGVSYTGPTGQGCTGPTGPSASFSGITGPTGPTGPSVPASTVTALNFVSGQPVVLPSQSEPIAYYSVTMTDSVGIISLNATNLSSGYEAVLFVSATTTSPNIQSTVNGPYNFFSNISIIPTIAMGNGTYAMITILSDGINYYGNVVYFTQ